MIVLKNILSNKWFWFTLGAIVLFLILRGPLTRVLADLKRLTMRDGGNYSTGLTDGAGNAVTGLAALARVAAIEALAQTAYNELNAGITSPRAREDALKALVLLNDTELRAAAKHYKLLSRDTSLYQAVDAAWMALSEVDEELMGRLSNIAMV